MDADEREIYYYLKGRPSEYVAAREICRRAGGKRRFQTDPGWAFPPISRMMERGIVESDGAAHYRLKPPPVLGAKKRKWVSPQIARILKDSGKDFQDAVILDQDLDEYYEQL